MWCVSSVPKPESTTAIARFDGGGNEQSVGEYGGLVGFAVAVDILDDENAIVRFLPGRDLRIDLGAGDPEPPLGIEVHLDRLGDLRIGGEEIDFESVGELQGLPLEFRIWVGNVLQVALRERGAAERKQSEGKRKRDQSSHGRSAPAAVRRGRMKLMRERRG